MDRLDVIGYGLSIARMLFDIGDTDGAKDILGEMASEWRELMKAKYGSGVDGWADDVDAELQRLSDAVANLSKPDMYK